MVGAMERVRVASGRRAARLAFREGETRIVAPGQQPVLHSLDATHRGRVSVAPGYKACYLIDASSALGFNDAFNDVPVSGITAVASRAPLSLG